MYFFRSGNEAKGVAEYFGMVGGPPATIGFDSRYNYQNRIIAGKSR